MINNTEKTTTYMSIIKNYMQWLNEAETPAPAQAAATEFKCGGLNFYKGGKTPAGSTTPTGEKNEFMNNLQGLTPQTICQWAADNNIPVTDNVTFQKAIYARAEKLYPGLIDQMWTKFGDSKATGEAGTRTVETFADGDLGARTIFLLKSEVTTTTTTTAKPDGTPFKIQGAAYETIFMGTTVWAAIMYATNLSLKQGEPGWVDTGNTDVLVRVFKGNPKYNGEPYPLPPVGTNGADAATYDTKVGPDQFTGYEADGTFMIPFGCFNNPIGGSLKTYPGERRNWRNNIPKCQEFVGYTKTGNTTSWDKYKVTIAPGAKAGEVLVKYLSPNPESMSPEKNKEVQAANTTTVAPAK